MVRVYSDYTFSLTILFYILFFGKSGRFLLDLFLDLTLLFIRTLHTLVLYPLISILSLKLPERLVYVSGGHRFWMVTLDYPTDTLEPEDREPTRPVGDGRRNED